MQITPQAVSHSTYNTTITTKASKPTIEVNSENNYLSSTVLPSSQAVTNRVTGVQLLGSRSLGEEGNSTSSPSSSLTGGRELRGSDVTIAASVCSVGGLVVAILVFMLLLRYRFVVVGPGC